MEKGEGEEAAMISVIIPVYNVEAYLSRCIDSIINNTYGDLEVICVDDGSPDGCGRIIDEYAERDSRVVAIHQENQGVAAARNRGIKASRGEYIAFVDSDDWIHPQYFEILVQMIQTQNADVAVCESVTLSEPEDYKSYNVSLVESELLSVRQIQKNYTVRYRCWARLYSRRALSGHWFSKAVRMGDDTVYNLDVLCHYPDLKLCYSRLPLYCYFVRADSITHSRPLTRVLDEAKWYYSHYKDEKESSGMEWLLRSHAIKTVLSARMWSTFDDDYDESLKNMRALLRRLLPRLLKSRFAPLREKAILLVMAKSPLSYRLFQYAVDPTVKEWVCKKRQGQTHQS